MSLPCERNPNLICEECDQYDHKTKTCAAALEIELYGPQPDYAEIDRQNETLFLGIEEPEEDWF